MKRASHAIRDDQFLWQGTVPHGPDWLWVKFPNNHTYRYLTLETANVGRIYARAWFNWAENLNPAVKPKTKTQWAAFARVLGMTQSPLKKDGSKRASGTGAAVGNPLYNHAMLGKLPKDPVIKQKLFDLAGYPWGENESS